HGRPFQPQVHYFVGGATKMFGAALYRLRQQDFGELKHYDGISPAWPISYADLEPYYAKAEEMYHVHGLRGHDPTEPPASGAYPCPPVSHEPRIAQLFEQLTAAARPCWRSRANPIRPCTRRPSRSTISISERTGSSTRWAIVR